MPRQVLLREAGFWIDKHLNGLEENGPGPAYQNTNSWINIWKLNWEVSLSVMLTCFCQPDIKGPGHVPPGLPDRQELPV